jgi:3-isopropylmalate/(R)-2-methylmalate dehydratase large subunit
MGLTVAEKIFAIKSGLQATKAGDVVFAAPDVIMLHEGGTFLLQRPLGELGVEKLAEHLEVVVLLDHYVPAPSVSAATRHKVTREFAKRMNISSWYEIGRGGICHQLLPEKGHIRPGEFIVGTDAHVTTYGAFNAYAVGVGVTDMAVTLATGNMWVVVPESIKVILKGELKEGVSGKDLSLVLLGMFGESTLAYKSVEIEGPGLGQLGVDDRMTIGNMASEMGIKAVIMKADRLSNEYVSRRTRKPFKNVWADEDAKYEDVREIDLSSIEPMVAKPSRPGNVVHVSEAVGNRIDQAFLGSCTNGRISDLRIAAEVLGDHQVHPDVRLIVTPASQEVYLQALDEGLIRKFIVAGALVTNPNCGACIGGHMGLLADGEVCISASNRNFVGRMGSTKGEIYLASPATVVASAIAGHIVDPRSID